MAQRLSERSLGRAIWVVDSAGRINTAAWILTLAVAVGVGVAAVLRAVSRLPFGWLVALGASIGACVLVALVLLVALVIGTRLHISQGPYAGWVTSRQDPVYQISLDGHVLITNATERQLLPVSLQVRTLAVDGKRLPEAISTRATLTPTEMNEFGESEPIGPKAIVGFRVHLECGGIPTTADVVDVDVRVMDQFNRRHPGRIKFQAWPQSVGPSAQVTPK